MNVDIPTELIDAILRQAYYSNGIADTLTLSACSLMCRAWSDSAQRLLFRHVLLRKVHRGPKFMDAIDPASDRGRTLGRHVRVLEVSIGDKADCDLDDANLATILSRTSKLYQLELRVTGIHQFGAGTMERLRHLANPSAQADRSENFSDKSTREMPGPLRIHALSLLSCGIQSPILYQLLSVFPTIEFLLIGVEIAAPPPRWQPEFKLYQLTLLRTPRLWIMSWLLSSSMDTLRIASFRDTPGRELNDLLEQLGPRLRSLRLMNYSVRVAAVLKYCLNLEEFVLVQLSTLLKLGNLPHTLEHLSCRNLPSNDQSLDMVIEAVSALPNLRVITCDREARTDKKFEALERLCCGKGVHLYVAETPLWVREDPVYVNRFPKGKSVDNFALMN